MAPNMGVLGPFNQPLAALSAPSAVIIAHLPLRTEVHPPGQHGSGQGVRPLAGVGMAESVRRRDAARLHHLLRQQGCEGQQVRGVVGVCGGGRLAGRLGGQASERTAKGEFTKECLLV